MLWAVIVAAPVSLRFETTCDHLSEELIESCLIELEGVASNSKLSWIFYSLFYFLKVIATNDFDEKRIAKYLGKGDLSCPIKDVREICFIPLT